MTLTETERDDAERIKDIDDVSTEAPVEPELRLRSKDGFQPVEKSEPKPIPNNLDADAQPEYISGWKLLLATGIVALASFTMLLDSSIVVTVSRIASVIEAMLIFEGNSPHH